MIRNGLRVTVDGVEGMRSEWSWDNPFMMGFVNVFVEEWNMEPSMNPVDTVVGEQKETKKNGMNMGSDKVGGWGSVLGSYDSLAKRDELLTTEQKGTNKSNHSPRHLSRASSSLELRPGTTAESAE